MELSDVFLSHNSQDKPLVRKLDNALTLRGFDVWFDEQDLPVGMPWIPRLESAIHTTATVFVAIGDAGIGPWQQPEIEAALLSAVDRKTPIVPILLARSSSDQQQVPTFLRRFTWVDFSDGIDETGLNRLARTIEIGRVLRDKGSSEKRTVSNDDRSPSESKRRRLWRLSRLSQHAAFVPVFLIPTCLFAFSPPLFADSWLGNASIGLLISLFLVLLSGFFAYAMIQRNIASTQNLINPTLGILLISSVVYIVMYLAFTESRSGTSLRSVSGIYSDYFRDVLAVNLDDYQQTKDDFEFDPERIYKPWSLLLAEAILILSFTLSSLAAGASAMIAKAIFSGELPQSKDNLDSLVAIELPTGLRRRLYSLGIETVSDLTSMTPRQLLHDRRINQESVQKIEKSLSQCGLALREDR
ncbi:toll/interleukin-1 receptor domain-containing protein [Rhodopirellula baltica]